MTRNVSFFKYDTILMRIFCSFQQMWTTNFPR